MMSGFTVLYAILLVVAFFTTAQMGKTIAIAQSLPDRDERFRWAPSIKKIWGLYAFVIVVE